MTDREKAIVMAYTGICMLKGDKFNIFHKYAEDIMGRPVYTHEFGVDLFTNELKKKAEPDFIALCKDNNSETKWVPVTERLPEEDGTYLVTVRDEDLGFTTDYAYYSTDDNQWSLDDEWLDGDIVAWMPMPEPYKPESEE